MRRSAKRLSLPVTLLAAGLLAGCGNTISSSIGSLPSRTATVSARPSVTVTVTSAPAAPATGTAAPAASSGTSLIWLWVLLGVLVLAGLIALIARSGRRRPAAAGWQSRLVDAYAKGSALHDAMSVAEAPGGLAGPDGAARWADIQRRADDLAQTLYALREQVPPDSANRARVDGTLASLQAVRSAMDAERVPGGASLGQADAVRSRLASFESSLRALGAPGRE